MAEPTASNYPTTKDDDTTLFGDAVDLISKTLDAGMTAGSAAVSVSESIADVNVPCYLRIGSEIIYTEATSSGDFTTLTRGARGTTAAAHSIGDTVFIVYSGNHHNQSKRAIIAIETKVDALALAVNQGGPSARRSDTWIPVNPLKQQIFN